LLFITLLSTSALAQKVCVYFFYGTTCPHCAEEKPFLEELKNKYPIELHQFEVYYNETNVDIWNRISSLYGAKPVGVPMTFIGEKAFIGFTKGDGQIYNPTYKAYIGYSNEIEKTIADYVAKGGVDCPQASTNITLPVNGNFSWTTNFYISIGVACAILVGLSIFFVKFVKIKVKVGD
jgi:thiol-disulfide isomerase/thioredoxin